MGTPLVLTQQIDATTWQALGLVLTIVGLAVSSLVWRRKGAGRGLRAVAWSLVPLAAGLTGVLRLAWELLDSVLRWATGLVFSPVVWVGLVVAGAAVALHLAGTLLLRRAARSSERSGRPVLAPRGEPYGVTAGTGEGGRPDKARGRGRKHDDELVEDQDDVEAILRRHGIS